LVSELFFHQDPDRVCGLKVLLEDPFGATSAPSELFRCSINCPYLHYHYYGLSGHLTS
jgi:hypothetical protein